MNSVNLPVKELKRAIKILSGVVLSNPVLPVLSNILISNKNGLIQTRASNLQVDVKVDLSRPSSTEEMFDFLIPFRDFRKLVYLLRCESISILHNPDTLSCSVICEEGEFKFYSDSSASFPRAVAQEGEMAFKIDTDLLKKSIEVAVVSASSDDLRPAMECICFDTSNDNRRLQVAATDGHTLSLFKTDVPYSGEYFLADRKVAKVIPLLSSKEFPYMKVFVGSSTVSFNCYGISIVSRKSWETYPGYKSVIPDEFSLSIQLASGELKRKILMASIFSSRTTHQVELTIQSEKMVLSSTDFDYGNGSSQFISIPGEREEFKIGVNSTFLGKLLKSFSGNVQFNFNQPNKPIIIYPECKEGSVTLLIMPVALNPSLT